MAQRKALSLTLALGCLWTLLSGFSLSLIDSPDVRMTLSSEAERLSLEAPLVATLEVTCPAHETVTFDELNTVFQGFATVDAFPVSQSVEGSTARAVWRLRVTPQGIGPWAVMPFVVTLHNTTTNQDRELLTSAVTFPEPLPLPAASGDPECNLEPERVPMAWSTIGLWALYALGAILLILACLPLVRRVHRTLQERKLSPEARAKLEMERLLAQNLVSQGQFKRFYYELTGVVRRYFERGYQLRATRQTTQEFLSALAQDPRFGAEERAALNDFLTSADRIKFAGVSATTEEAEAATSLAQTTISTDAARRRATASGEA